MRAQILSSKADMRIGMVGLGDIACKAYLPVVATSLDVELILCTRDAATLARLQQQYHVDAAVTDVQALIALAPDAVMVHSATPSHAHIIRQLLNAGIPVFVDKPLSYEIEECEELINLAASKNISLTVGFNRRFAPLIAPLGNCENLVQVRMQKNRTRLPDNARRFIYDDFIHVVDSLRFFAPGKPHNFSVFSYLEGNDLAAIQVQWQVGQVILSGSMNRLSGASEERLEVFAADQKWQIDNLSAGMHYANLHEKQRQYRPMAFSDWENTLVKRGFVPMFNAWLAAVKAGESSDYGDILATHQLCEEIVLQVNTAHKL